MRNSPAAPTRQMPSSTAPDTTIMTTAARKTPRRRRGQRQQTRISRMIPTTYTISTIVSAVNTSSIR